MGEGISKQTLAAVDRPFTDVELVGLSIGVVGKLISSGTSMPRMVERDDLHAMAREAVVIADRRYKPCSMTRRNWVLSKGEYLVKDRLRAEARHEVCMTAREFRGIVRDEDGQLLKPRTKVPMGEDSYEEDGPQHPIMYLRGEVGIPLTTLHNNHLRERFERALDTLPDQRTAAAFRLIVWHEWTQEDVAEVFEVTASRVSQMLERSRGRLQAIFSDLAEEQRAA